MSTARGFSGGKANIFTYANLSLGELTSIKKYLQRSFFETERLSIISYCSVPTGDSYMKESGMLVVSLRSVNQP